MTEFQGFKCDGCGKIREGEKKQGALEVLVPKKEKVDAGPWIDAEVSIVGDQDTLVEGHFCEMVCLIKKLQEGTGE